MRGNLSVLSKLLAVLCDDLDPTVASQGEREAAVVMGALHAAIVLQETAALAALVEGWYDEHSAAAVMKLLERRQQ